MLLVDDGMMDQGMTGRDTARPEGKKVMNEQWQSPKQKSQLSREEMAVYLAARYAMALMQNALMGAVQYADDMGGLQAGDIRIDRRLPMPPVGAGEVSGAPAGDVL